VLYVITVLSYPRPDANFVNPRAFGRSGVLQIRFLMISLTHEVQSNDPSNDFRESSAREPNECPFVRLSVFNIAMHLIHVLAALDT
jgi:hypothetical protein